MELVDGQTKPCTTWDGVKGMHWEVEIHYLKRLAEFYPSVFVTNYSRDYCSFKMSTDVISAVGDTAASAFASWRRGLCIGTSLTRDPILEHCSVLHFFCHSDSTHNYTTLISIFSPLGLP